jgi:FkbM family methyltransferase
MIFYLKLIWTYLFLKLKLKTSKHGIWRLDFFIFAWKNKIIIVSENRDSFTVKVKLNNWRNFKIRHYPSSDFSVFKTIIVNKQYELEYNLIQRNEITIIDAGANVGYTSIFYKDKYPSAKIIAIEPFYDNLVMLEENIKINNFSNIFIERKALWFDDAKLYLNFNFRDSKEHSVRTTNDQSDNVSCVDAISISNLNKQYEINTINILKLDIEGSEKDIFENDLKINDILNKTENLVIEIHDEFNCRNNIVDILKVHYNQIDNIGELTLGKNIDL